MKYWIVSWDCEGVEHLEEITEHHPDRWAEQHLFDSIKESKRVEKPLGFPLHALKLRAMYNSHRHYEIYIFTSNEDIEASDLRAWFTNEPQSFADWVRKNHSYKVWDQRRAEKPAIV